MMKDPSFEMLNLDTTKTNPHKLLREDRECMADLQADEVVEVPLLLPGWQVSVLEREAHHRGLTAAEMVRHLLREFIAGTPPGKNRPKAEML